MFLDSADLRWGNQQQLGLTELASSFTTFGHFVLLLYCAWHDMIYTNRSLGLTVQEAGKSVGNANRLSDVAKPEATLGGGAEERKTAKRPIRTLVCL